MKIALLGSLGNINRFVVPELVKQGHEVTVVTSSEARVPQIEALGAKAAVGTMTDVSFLTKTFTNKEVVHLMVSGASQGGDLNQELLEQGKIFRQAISEANVHKLVQLSSVGADAGPEAGSVHAYHYLEAELKKMTDVDIAIVRPVGFYNNLYGDLSTIKEQHAIYSNIPANVVRKYVAPQDIAAVVLPLILAVPKGVTVRYVVSDTFTIDEFIESLAKEANLPDLHFVPISDEAFAQSLLERKVPKAIVKAFVTSSQYQKDPKQIYGDLTERNTKIGTFKLTDFVAQYAQAIKAPKTHHRSSTIVD